MRVALLQLAAIQKSRSANLQSLMAAIDGAASNDDELDLLRDHISTFSRFGAERAYGDIMIKTASPERMVHLEQRLANDGHLAELTRKAKQQMEEPARG